MTQQDIQIELIVGGPTEAQAQSEELAKLYVRDFVDPPLQGTYFYSKERFLERLLKQYVPAPNFRIITARKDSELIGFIYGCSLPKGTQWWKDFKGSLPEDFQNENGRRTLALLDALVKREYRDQGFGRRFHDKLMDISGEERVTLLSSSSQQPAYAIWQHLGYEKIGTAQPAGSTAVLDAFIRNRP